MMGRWCLLPTLLVACTTGNPVFLPPDDGGDDGDGATTDDLNTGPAGSTASSGGDPPATTGEPPAPMTSSAGGPGVTASGGTGDASSDATSDASSDATSDVAPDTTGDTIGTGDASTGAVGPCTDECGTPGCGACPDDEMVGLPGFEIAAREASNAQYAQFLAADVDPAMQPAACAWNDDFTPTSWPPPADAAALPVVRVDWCDAQAFCAWTGRRLCGGIGGGASSFAAVTNPLIDQWYLACTAGLGIGYPYGPFYDPAACNGKDAGLAAPVASGSLPACEGPLFGLFDLSGNVWEWVDNCSGDLGETDECLRRGGSFNSVPADLRCDLMSKRPRNLALDHVGVRCCQD